MTPLDNFSADITDKHKDILLRHAGVYVIQSIQTKKMYIGSTTNFRQRWGAHQRSFIHNTCNAILQHHIRKYGADDLLFSPLKICINDQKVLKEAEQTFLDLVSSQFNIRKSAYDTNPKMGVRVMTDALREKYAKHRRGTKLSELTKEKIKAARARQVITKESILKAQKTREGYLWINNPTTTVNKRVTLEKYNTFYKPQGYVLGRFMHITDEYRQSQREKTSRVWSSGVRS